MLSRKCVVVGDSKVGKTHFVSASAAQLSLALQPVLAQQSGPPLGIMPEFECQFKQGSKCIGLQVCDTDGSEPSEDMRRLAYWGANVFIIIFSLHSVKSFKNVQAKWIPEIFQSVPLEIPFILVGTSKNDGSDKKVSDEEVRQLMSDLNCQIYHVLKENSSENCHKILQQAASISKANNVLLRKGLPKSCNIL